MNIFTKIFSKFKSKKENIPEQKTAVVSSPRVKTNILTLEKFTNIFPRAINPGEYFEHINSQFSKYPNVKKEDIAMFLAQCGHESAEFTIFEENLNYSAEALLRVFPKYFKDMKEASLYSRKPREIANRVYANRMGNGPENSGDGWKYRGRGIIQITGKNNYRKLSIHLYSDPNVLLNNPDFILRPKESVLSAFWFWETNRLFGIYDIEQATRIINGGLNGLAHRKSLYEKILKML
ncbi:MAG: glycoside hydrolase family 19 protein [Candidatus Dojkabacteria bacterium]|nr:glycoside hydrolase family 19 protein [Candidatus Dojkabacteria bacterium]